MYNIKQFKSLIVRPALRYLNAWTESAEKLLILTCAQESLGGTYLAQAGGGPAIGAYQMEEATYNDIWVNFIPNRPGLTEKAIQSVCMTRKPPFMAMAHNVFYATVMARIFYLRIDDELPNSDDLEGIAKYYKVFWNSRLGKATEEDAIKNYHLFNDG
jgi:hypothetical protein